MPLNLLEDGYSETRLSRDKAKRLTAWHDLEEAMETGKIVTGMVNGKVSNGLTAMINGIRAFLPGSLVDIRPVKDTTPYENKEMDFKVDQARSQTQQWWFLAVLSWKHHGADRETLLSNLQEGAVVQGIVKNITDRC